MLKSQVNIKNFYAFVLFFINLALDLEVPFWQSIEATDLHHSFCLFYCLEPANMKHQIEGLNSDSFVSASLL